MAKVKSILGMDEAGLAEFKVYMEEKAVGRLETVKTGTCADCGDIAEVADAANGTLRCSHGHKTIVDPEALVMLSLDSSMILRLVQQLAQTGTRLEIPATDIEELLPFSSVKIHLVGRAQAEEIKVAVLLPLKKLELRDACILLGFLAFMSEHVFLVLSDAPSDEARSLLAYKSNGAVQIWPLSSVFENPKSLNDVLLSIPTGVTGETIRLASWIRERFQSLKLVVSPAAYKKIIAYDDQLVNESFHAATHGDRTRFEDCVAALFSSVMPTTQLGHALSGMEVPDGIVIVPSKPPNLIFYDCKTTGSVDEESKVRAIRQSDEDEFARYVQLFRGTTIPANLIAGCFVANDFSEENLLNKAIQIRQRTPNGIKIVFFPLSSLVKLYANVTTDRLKFQLRFRPERHFEKLLGMSLTQGESKLLETDPRFKTYAKVRDLGVDAVFVTETLVDVFLQEVGNATPMDQSFLPFVIEEAKRASTKA